MDKIILFVLIFFLLTGCPASNACIAYQPIYMIPSDLQVVDKETLRQIVSHNRVYEVQCKKYLNERKTKNN